MPWIHIADEVGLILFAAETPAVSGPLNLASPQPVTNAAFTRALAASLRRPGFLHAPAFMLRTLLGDLANEMLLVSQRVLPEKALSLGYRFQFTDLQAALAQVLAR
jgi:hypothetical protein